jgi:hypothetical protein
MVTDGFDTADLKDAQTLDALARPSPAGRGPDVSLRSQERENLLPDGNKP